MYCPTIPCAWPSSRRVFGCEMDFADPERTARAGIEPSAVFFHSLGMPITFCQELGAEASDIPAMVAHRAEKPNGFPFGGFVKIRPADMEAFPPGFPGCGSFDARHTSRISPELPGAHVEGVLEGPQEGGIVPEARLLRRLHHRHPGPDQLPARSSRFWLIY